MTQHPEKKSLWRTAVIPPALGFGFLLLLLLPGVLIGLFLVSGAASILLFGALPVAAAFFGGATKSSIQIIALMTSSGTLARVFDQDPLPSALLMAVVAFTIGLTARRGLTSPILIVGISLGFLIISPPQLGQSGHQVLDTLNPVLVTAALLLIGGLWARLVIAVIQKRIPPTKETSPGNPRELIPYALALAVSTSVSTYFLLTYSPGGLGAWLVLTIFVVLKVDPDKTWKKTKDRLIGTLSGAALALIVIEILSVLKWNQGLIQLFIALLFVGTAMSYFVPGPYWKYVFFLTPGVVLLDSNAVANQTDVAAWRVLYTLMGIGLALGIGALIHLVTHSILRVDSPTPDQSH